MYKINIVLLIFFTTNVFAKPPYFKALREFYTDRGGKVKEFNCSTCHYLSKRSFTAYGTAVILARNGVTNQELNLEMRDWCTSKAKQDGHNKKLASALTQYGSREKFPDTFKDISYKVEALIEARNSKMRSLTQNGSRENLTGTFKILDELDWGFKDEAICKAIYKTDKKSFINAAVKSASKTLSTFTSTEKDEDLKISNQSRSSGKEVKHKQNEKMPNSSSSMQK